MKKQTLQASKLASHHAMLRRRVKGFYQKFNQEEWERCFIHLDPRLRRRSRISQAKYAESLAAFKQYYGQVNIWHLRINLHLEVHNNKQDDRPFAYVYVFWQDDRKAFHVFRERWVKEAGRWYTRVVGLVVHKSE